MLFRSGEFYPVVFEKNGIGRPEISAVQIEIIRQIGFYLEEMHQSEESVFQFKFVSAIQDGNIVERGG